MLRLASLTILPEKPLLQLGKCEEIAFLLSRRVPMAIRIFTLRLFVRDSLIWWDSVLGRQSQNGPTVTET